MVRLVEAALLMAEARQDSEHWREVRDRWFGQRNRRQERDSYADDWYAEQCGRCEYWIPLAGHMGYDYGACSNSASAFDGRVRFEHDGCPAFSAGEEWATPADFAE